MDTATLTTVDPSWAAIIAAISALVTAIGGLVLAFSVFLPTLRTSRVALTKVDEVHHLVNSQHDALLSYQETLVGALRDADVTVPANPPLRPTQPPLSRP